MLNGKFNAFYKELFYGFVTVGIFEIMFSLWLYPRLKDMIPMHIGIGGVDSVTNAKYTIFLLPLACIFASCVLKSEIVDSKYIKGSPTSNILKIIFFLLQVVLAFVPVYYFYVTYKLYTL